MNFKELEQRIIYDLNPLAKAVYKALADNKISLRDLADRFEIGESTIIHWLYNNARPAKLVEKQIIEYLNSL